MSVRRREQLCLGAFLRFDKFDKPEVREYYNSMVRNIVRGLGIQMHRVENLENLKKLMKTVRLTHLFISETEYKADSELMEEFAAKMLVVVVADPDFALPANSKVRLMPKPFYCFPVASMLNMDMDTVEEEHYRLHCKGARALVVDDEPMNLTVARSILKRYGMVVTTASSGPESVTLCKKQPFDIVFMDHMMPGMDGIECLHALRSQAGGLCRETPVIVLTANVGREDEALYRSEGFDAYLQKPLDADKLEETLLHVLPESLTSVRDAAAPQYRAGADVRARPKIPMLITTESVSDLPKALLKKLHIPVILSP